MREQAGHDLHKAQMCSEQLKAYQVFKDALPKQEELTVSQVTEDHITSSDCKIFIKGKLDSLPHGDNWVWSDEKAQIIADNDKTQVSVKKLNPVRMLKNDHSEIYPPYTLWIFKIREKVTEDKEYNFIWCEKGENDYFFEEWKENPSYYFIELIQISNIQQLSFLKSDMEESVATLIFGDADL